MTKEIKKKYNVRQSIMKMFCIDEETLNNFVDIYEKELKNPKDEREYQLRHIFYLIIKHNVKDLKTIQELCSFVVDKEMLLEAKKLGILFLTSKTIEEKQSTYYQPKKKQIEQ